MLNYSTTASDWSFIVHNVVASSFRHSTVFTVFSHADCLPDVLLLAGCLHQACLWTVLAQRVGDVLAVVYM